MKEAGTKKCSYAKQPNESHDCRKRMKSKMSSSKLVGKNPYETGVIEHSIIRISMDARGAL